MESDTVLRSNSRLRASERCCDLFISRGTTDLPIAEVAAAIGISQRTFHRHFPFKAASIGPVLDASIERANSVIVNSYMDTPLSQVLLQAFCGGLLGEAEARTKGLFPLVFRDAEMWSVFIRKLHDGERSLGPILAPRLNLGTNSVAARAAAAAVASSIRIALESMVSTGADPETAYVEMLAEFGPGVLCERVEPPSATSPPSESGRHGQSTVPTPSPEGGFHGTSPPVLSTPGRLSP